MSPAEQDPASLSVAELLAVLDALPGMLSVWDAGQRNLFANQPVLEWLGRSRHEVRDARFADLVDPAVAALMEPTLEQVLDGQHLTLERAVIGDPGELGYFQIQCLPTVVDGTVTGFVILATDISARVASERRARQRAAEVALRNARRRVAADLDWAVIERLVRTTQILHDNLAPGPVTGPATEPQPPGLTEAITTVDKTILDLRSAISALRSSPPREVGSLHPQDVEIVPRMRGGPARAGGTGTVAQDGVEPVRPMWKEPSPEDEAGWTVADLLGYLDLVPAAITVFDTDFVAHLANAASVALLGRRSRSEVQGRDARDLLGDELYTTDLPYAEKAVAGAPQCFERSFIDTRGRRIHTLIDYAPLRRRDTVVGMVAMVTDFTDRIEAEAELRSDDTRLALAQDRQRIAEDLHDRVIQRLFAAGLDIQAATRAATPTARERAIRAAIRGIAAAKRELDASIHGLGRAIEPYDLVAELGVLMTAARRAWGGTPRLQYVGPLRRLTPLLANELLAVVSEGMSNALRHADAHTVDVLLRVEEREVKLQIADDGHGGVRFNPDSGTGNMLARAERLHGTCTWRDNQPHGTVLDWRVPLAER